MSYIDDLDMAIADMKDVDLEYLQEYPLSARENIKILREAAIVSRSAVAEVIILKNCLKDIRDYPKFGDERADEEGYPSEIVYDEFAYKRIVDSYRKAAAQGIKESEDFKF